MGSIVKAWPFEAVQTGIPVIFLTGISVNIFNGASEA